MAEDRDSSEFINEDISYDIAGFNNLLLLSFISDAYFKLNKETATLVKQDMGAYTTAQIFDIAKIDIDVMNERFTRFIEQNRFSPSARRIFRYYIFVVNDYEKDNEKYAPALCRFNDEFIRNGIISEFIIVDIKNNKVSTVEGKKVSERKIRVLIEKTLESYRKSIGGGESTDSVVYEKQKEIVRVQRELGQVKRVGFANPMTLLIIVNIIFFIAGLISSQKTGVDVFKEAGIQDNVLIMDGEWWRLVTSMFLHADIAHIAGNMFFLFYLGSIVLRYYNSFEFFTVYFLSGLAGNVLSMVFTDYRSLGASGAIMGLGGLIIYRMFFGKNAKAFRRNGNYIVFALMIIFNLLYGLFATEENIDNYGHFGGFIGGFIVAYVIDFLRSRLKKTDA